VVRKRKTLEEQLFRKTYSLIQIILRGVCQKKEIGRMREAAITPRRISMACSRHAIYVFCPVDGLDTLDVDDLNYLLDGGMLED
jgi:hypothetical protein